MSKEFTMTYKKLIEILQGRRPMSGSLGAATGHLSQDVTVYDSDADEYFPASLQLSHGSDVLDDGHLILVTK
jgi:hypothetical protein